MILVAKTISITLPDDISEALADLSKTDGVSADEVVGRAVKQHVFLRKFRLLRERLSTESQIRGVLTDQDVFDRVS